LKGRIPVTLAKPSSLRNLALSHNQLSGEIPSGWNITEFFIIDLSQNQLSGSIPASLVTFGSANGSDRPVQIVNLSHNLLNGSIPTPSHTLYPDRLDNGGLTLDLSHNQLGGPVPWQILTYGSIYLGNNRLTGDVIDALNASQAFGGAVTFPQIYLENNLLTGDLSRLTFSWHVWSLIDLSHNKLSWMVSQAIPDPVGAALSNMAFATAHSKGGGLLGFSVAGNNFSGTPLPITASFSMPKSLLSVLDLSNCQLHGLISGEVFNASSLGALTVLDLSKNSATGSIPESITTLPYLESLDVSNNHLSGPIPESITTMPYLTSLDVSNNNLSGILPPILPNSSLNNPNIYAGNKGLCGYQLAPCPRPASPPAFQLQTPHQTGIQWWIFLVSIGGSMIVAAGSCLMLTWRWKVYQKRHEQDADLIKTLMERGLVTLMSLSQLKKATNNFAQSSQIGEGGYRTVYKGKLSSGTMVAIKRCKRESSGKDKDQFLNEVRILSQINHRHLVRLMGCCMENMIALLVLEFVPNGTLQEHLQGESGSGPLTWKQRLDIAV
jgi:hypothetical protein